MNSIIDLVLNGTLFSIKGLPEKVGNDILYIFTEIVGNTELIEKLKDFPVCKVIEDYGLEYRANLGAKDSNGDIVIPIGFLKQVKEYLINLNYRFNIIQNNNYPPINIEEIELSSHLRSYQKEAALKGLKEKIGIIQLPTGAGKTEINIEILKHCPTQANKLVLVPTKGLLYQTVNSFKNRLGVDIGIIGDGHFDIKEITIGIPNTIDIRLKEQCSLTLNYCKSIYALMVDECHDVISEPRVWRMISQMENKVITIGFSATPWLEGGLGKVMDALLGKVIVEGKVSDFMDAGVIETPIIQYHVVPKPPLPPSLLTRLNKSKRGNGYDMSLMNVLYNTCIVKHKTRNELIVELVKERLAMDSGPIALVVNRVGTSSSKNKKGTKAISHSDILKELIQEKLGLDFPLLHGGTSSNDSKIIVNQLINGEIPGVIAGPAALTNGLDIPCLNAVFLCAGGKKLSDVLQRIGRVLRRFDNNSNKPLVVDFYDNVLYFKNHSEGRIKICRDTYGIDNVKIIEK